MGSASSGIVVATTQSRNEKMETVLVSIRFEERQGLQTLFHSSECKAQKGVND